MGQQGDSYGPLLVDLLTAKALVWVATVGRDHELTVDAHLFFFDRLLAWPAVIPWYALKTRGPGGWRLAVGLFALILSAYVAGTLTWLIMAWVELRGS
jgi:hypothetical protein